MQNSLTSYKRSPGYLPLSQRHGAHIALHNDYLFKAVLQTNEDVLRALLCSLLRLKQEDITSIEITNPIILGGTIDDKSVVLDIRLILNRGRLINLEMQVINYRNWEERSLTYLCRLFDSLGKGEDYLDIMPAHHISILDFPIAGSSEFFDEFYIMSRKTHKIYSDKLRLSVLNLTHVKQATDEDKEYCLDQWAALFQSTTWEEIKMLAEKNPIFEKAADSIYTLTQDALIREQCRRREEELAYEKWRENKIKEMENTIRQQNKTLQEKDARIEELEKALTEAQVRKQKQGAEKRQ